MKPAMTTKSQLPNTGLFSRGNEYQPRRDAGLVLRFRLKNKSLRNESPKFIKRWRNITVNTEEDAWRLAAADHKNHEGHEEHEGDAPFFFVVNQCAKAQPTDSSLDKAARATGLFSGAHGNGRTIKVRVFLL